MDNTNLLALVIAVVCFWSGNSVLKLVGVLILLWVFVLPVALAAGLYAYSQGR